MAVIMACGPSEQGRLAAPALSALLMRIFRLELAQAAGAAVLQTVRREGAGLALGLALVLVGGSCPCLGVGAARADQAGVTGLQGLVAARAARAALS